MNESQEGVPASFELVPLPDVLQSKVLGQTSTRIDQSRNLVVTDVATDFRIEAENPLGEALRLIVAITVTFYAPALKVSRLFRRYYVYEATDFTPERLQATLRDMANDIGIAASEIRAGVPCTFDGQELRRRRHPGRRPGQGKSDQM